MNLLVSLGAYPVLQSVPRTGPGRKGESAALLPRHRGTEKHHTPNTGGGAQSDGSDVLVPAPVQALSLFIILSAKYVLE